MIFAKFFEKILQIFFAFAKFLQIFVESADGLGNRRDKGSLIPKTGRGSRIASRSRAALEGGADAIDWMIGALQYGR